ncbi:DUF5615 family PIN-like protein [Kamptonema sp. UHCC 0994]|uniref:DUF5615 family PIN-like protein n=1 Tax=Kamptonema sp. UHCC 0994 TaxID=3031329 RepID=UPI0023B9E7CC|nr:DUF5615 family PIN-like protein [Kamptonema sp. UHCC 0994]MDF0551791.1 DUF5615 family PIN-like protein [Kamptonema sp. UHCC 0994]
MKIRFQADADLNQSIVTGTVLRQPNIDFQTASLAGLEGLDDREVLAVAARESRIIVSHDRKTMPIHFAEFIMTNTSPGILIVSQNLAVNSAIEALILIWEASSAEEWVNQIASIPI